MNILLLESTVLNLATKQPEVLCVTTGAGGYMTLPSDNPPNTFYFPRLKVPSVFQCAMFRDGIQGGFADGGYGAVQINNQDGVGVLGGGWNKYRDETNYAFDGQPMRLLYGDGDGPYSGFVPLITGMQCQPEWPYGLVNLKIRDYTELFSRPISQRAYLGNNIAGAGTEGTPDDWMGKSKPLCFGKCHNISPPMVSQAWVIFDIHDGPIKAVDAMRVDGIWWPLDCGVNGTVETATATCSGAYSLTLAGVNKTSIYVAGLLLTITYTLSGAVFVGNLVVVSSSFAGGNTVVTLQAPPGLIQYTFSLASGAAINRVAFGGGDCASVDALRAVTPQSRMFVTCLVLGKAMAAGGVASGVVTMDVRGDNTGGVYVSTMGGCVKRIATNYTRRQYFNLALFSEQFTNPVWVPLNTTVGGPAASSPSEGMGTAVLSETAATGVHSLSQTFNQGTGMYAFSVPVLPGRTRNLVRMKLTNPANPANSVTADLDLVTGDVLLLTSAGAAVGPQYTATGFITDGGVFEEPDGWMRCWVAGQPDQTFSQIRGEVVILSGTPESYTDTYGGDPSAFIGVGGAQLEAYSSPSLYAGPTLDAPVTAFDPPVGPTVNEDSFAALDAVAPYEVGIWIPPGDTSTSGDVAAKLLNSGMASGGFDNSGALFVMQLSRPDPDAVPVLTFDESQVLRDSVQHLTAFTNSDGTPAYTISLSVVKNWTVQSKSSLASTLWTASPTLVAWLSKEWREVRAVDMDMRRGHPLSPVLSFTSYFSNQADGLTMGRRILDYYSGPLDRFSFDVKLDSIPLAQMPLLVNGALLGLPLMDWGLTDRENFVLVGIQKKFETGRFTLEVLG